MSAREPAGRQGDWLVVEDLQRRFDGHAAVDGVSFALDEGEIGVLLGPSGCGKTTTLRCIAGFEVPDRGRIRARGRALVGEGRVLEPHERGIGFVFQDGALFPHLSVRANVEFGLHALPARERRRRVDELLAALDLAALANRHPAQLSGGQQQRIALARALAPRPDTILLDEPFSSLDPSLRERLALELRDWLRHFGVTALVVTHDQREALGLADRIGVMHAGRLEQWASPYEVYHRPASRFVAGFVGQGVLLPARVAGDGELATELGPIRATHLGRAVGEECEVLLRPDDLVPDRSSALRCRIVERAFRGSDYLYTVELPSGRRLLATAPSHDVHAVGELLGLQLDADHVVVF
jgi:iron(III) transport system ATP-binding protein